MTTEFEINPARNMSCLDVRATFVSTISRYELVPADNQSAQITELAQLFNRWIADVKPALENGTAFDAAIEVGDHSDQPEVVLEEIILIDCHVKGEVGSGSGTLIVGKSGHCEAEAFVGTALVEGVVSGNIHASELIALGNEAFVIGHIEAPIILIGRGAIFEGTCHMLSPTESNHDSDSEPPHSSISFSYDAEGDAVAVAAAG